jgi:predicted nucleic acid-binding protein
VVRPAQFVVVFADRNLCRWWAEACERARKNGFVIPAGDAWIAATALALDVPLVTHNVGDYRGIDGLNILSAAP